MLPAPLRFSVTLNLHLFTNAAMGLVSNYESSDGSSSAFTKDQRLAAAFSALVHCLLCSALSTYGWLIWRRNSSSETKPVSFKTGFLKQNDKVSGVVPLLLFAAFIFGARSVYDMLLVAGDFAPIVFSVLWSTSEQSTMLKYVAPYYLGADLLPTVLLLLYFRAVPRTPPRPRHIPQKRCVSGWRLRVVQE